jgi:hypothetical protein
VSVSRRERTRRCLIDRFVEDGRPIATGLCGYAGPMSETPEDEARVASRGQLLPEEQAAGSEDPELQAEQILRESDERTEHPQETGEASTQTSTPDERPERHPTEEE